MTEIILKFVGKIQKSWHFENIFYALYPACISNHCFLTLFKGVERTIMKVFDEVDLEKERQDMVQKMEAKNRKTLQYKRSFFVRMVSDPKIYNPKIVKLKQDMSLVDETPTSPTM